MNARHSFRTLLLCGALAAACLTFDTVAQSAAPCDRACLKDFVDGYFGALAARDPKRLPVATPVKYTENGRVLDLGRGLLEDGRRTARLSRLHPRPRERWGGGANGV